jgi:hypothetical protein
VPGTPLAWADKALHFPLDPAEPSKNVEARWTPLGASCLNTPRLYPRTTVELYCKPAKCTGNVFDLGGIDWISLRR